MPLLIFLLVLFGIVVFWVQRSPIGQRYGQKYPRWVGQIASKRPPAYFRSEFSYSLSWVLRRIYPVVNGITGVKVLGVLLGEPLPQIPLSTTTWITINAGVTAVWTAGWAFAPNRRNGPLSLWAAWLGAVITISGGLIFQIVIIGYEFGWFGEVSWAPVTFALSSWATTHSVEDAVGFTLTVVGLGVAILALQEGAPDIGHPDTTPADMKLGVPRATTENEAVSPSPAETEPDPRKRGSKSSKRRKRRKRKQRRR